MSWCSLRRLGSAALLVGASVGVAAGESMPRWQSLFDQVPLLPTTVAEVVPMVAARTLHSDILGVEQLRIEVADPRLRSLQQAVDRLYEPIGTQMSERFRRVMKIASEDPQVAAQAAQIGRSWSPGTVRPGALPSAGTLREVERMLDPEPGEGGTRAPQPSAIESYAHELRSASPRAAQLLQRMASEQRRFALLHAQADRDAAALGATAVARHHQLAQQRLDGAAMLVREAREAFAPRVQRLVELGAEAERRDAPLAEISQVHLMLKAQVELLLTLQREVIQDVGFWAGLRAAASAQPPRYEHALAPGFDLGATGEMPFGQAYYPILRMIVVDAPPGIR